MAAMGGGYLITGVSFFKQKVSSDVKVLCYVMSAVIFLLTGIYMLYRTLRKDNIEERLREFRFRRILVEAVTIAVFTFACGIGCGFLETSIMATFVTIACATLLAVIAGLQAGYHQGYRFLKLGYALSCAIFLGVGVEVIIRYI